ncbi:hypothetical protein WKH57_00750 [Niallia taxi]|uniref:hypothetical protein n=1 Tax=Niallia taxi TaxID=2499688 RepID=UPI003173BF47
MIIGTGIGTSYQKLPKRERSVYDSFNRVNSLSIGMTDSGHEWQQISGGWGITDNQCYISTPLVSNVDRLILDSKLNDCEVSVQLNSFGENPSRLIFRYLDTYNEFFVLARPDQYIIQRRREGTLTTLGASQTIPVAGDTVKVRLKGANITFYVNDIQKIQISDSFNQLATKHGLCSINTTRCRFDNFKIEEIL